MADGESEGRRRLPRPGQSSSGQVRAPPLKPGKGTSPEDLARWETDRKAQSSQRICVEHANAEHKQWRPLQHYIGSREYCDETHLAIAALVSDRAAER